MLQTLVVDHHKTNRETQDAIKVMGNSIDKLVQLLVAKFFPYDASSQEGTPWKVLRRQLVVKREYNHFKSKSVGTYWSSHKKKDFSMKSNNQKDIPSLSKFLEQQLQKHTL